MFAIKSGNQYVQDVLGGNVRGPKIVWSDEHIRVFQDTPRHKRDMFEILKTVTLQGIKAEIVELVEKSRD